MAELLALIPHIWDSGNDGDFVGIYCGLVQKTIDESLESFFYQVSKIC